MRILLLSYLYSFNPKPPLKVADNLAKRTVFATKYRIVVDPVAIKQL
jgi:hypothetical protein